MATAGSCLGSLAFGRAEMSGMYTSICQEYRGIKAPEKQAFERGMDESDYVSSSSNSSGLALVNASVVPSRLLGDIKHGMFNM